MNESAGSAGSAGSAELVLDAHRPAVLRLRHRPVQKRGQVRFDGILGAARSLLMAKGIEGFVVEDVAEVARIPVGSVYQYFPNKLAIVAELAERDTDALVDVLQSSGGLNPHATLRQNVEEFISLVVERWIEQPSRSAVWLAMKSTSATRELSAENSQRVAATLVPLLQRLHPGLSQERVTLVATVLVETCQSVLLLAFREGGTNLRVVEELKRLVRGYLRGLALGR